MVPMSQGREAGGPTALRTGICRVWWGHPAALADAGRELMDAVERRRMAKLRRHDDQARFAAGCGIARLALAAFLGCPPAAVVLDRTCWTCGQPHGRPRLRPPVGASLDFSVSHSGDRVAVALTIGMRVGVDVEAIRSDLPVEAMAPSVLSAKELDAFGRVAPQDRTRRLLESWTRKEAVLKALGVGLRIPPARIQTLRELAGVTVRELHPGEGHVAAVAVFGPSVAVEEHDALGLLEG
jgi:4'-phosphopantetheinyl transferase